MINEYNNSSVSNIDLLLLFSLLNKLYYYVVK